MMPPKMPGEFDEGGILLAHSVQNTNRAGAFIRQPHDAAPRTSEFALQRLYLRGRRMKMLLKQSFENVHEISLSAISILPANRRPPALRLHCFGGNLGGITA